MIEVLCVVVLCLILDYAKLSWHGMYSNHVAYVLLHYICAWFLTLTAVGDYISADQCLIVTTVFVGCHFYTIEEKRKGIWYGKLFSALSSWPFQLAALGSLGWNCLWAAPLVGIGNLVMWMDLVRIYTGNEKYRLRPKHWKKSFWERLVM